MQVKLLICLFLPVVCGLVWAGPYAPKAGDPNSTAIDMDDPNIVAWATGYEDYFVGTNCDIGWQTPAKGLGKAEGTAFEIVCLGRGGEITMTFASGIGDREGYDLAVFENGVRDDFLELGYVEVSSDGVNFFRFENDSVTPDPVGAFGSVDATEITGFASKYMMGYGTPFDLAELRGVSGLLDVDNVKWVRIIDIVGDGTYLDSSGDSIYDPYATIGSAGFDLDAVGALHMRTGDFDESGGVDETDLAIISDAWMSRTGDARWNQWCDISDPNDGVIDVRDFGVFVRQWRDKDPNNL